MPQCPPSQLLVACCLFPVVCCVLLALAENRVHRKDGIRQFVPTPNPCPIQVLRRDEDKRQKRAKRVKREKRDKHRPPATHVAHMCSVHGWARVVSARLGACGQCAVGRVWDPLSVCTPLVSPHPPQPGPATPGTPKKCLHLKRPSPCKEGCGGMRSARHRGDQIKQL